MSETDETTAPAPDEAFTTLPPPVAALPYIETGNTRYLNVNDVSALFGVDVATLRSWRKRGTWALKSMRFGKGSYYAASGVASEWLKRDTERQGETPETPDSSLQSRGNQRDTLSPTDFVDAISRGVAAGIGETLQGRDALVSEIAVLKHRVAILESENAELKARGSRDKLTLQERLTGRLDSV